MNHIYGWICTLGCLLVLANGAYFMFTGKFTAFGLDRLVIALFRGLGTLGIDALRALGGLLADGIRTVFRAIFPRGNQQQQRAPQVHIYHHYPPLLADPQTTPPPLADPQIAPPLPTDED